VQDLVVGRIVRSHGVRGELVVEIRTDEPEDRFAPGSVLRGRAPKARAARDVEYTVEAARHHAGRLLVRLEGVADRDAADALRGTLLLIDAAELTSPEDPEEFYDHQLIGLTVHHVDGSVVGEVTEVVHTPAGQLLTVRTAAGQDALVPFVTAIVPEVDVAAGRVVVDPPEGLLDPDRAETADGRDD